MRLWINQIERHCYVFLLGETPREVADVSEIEHKVVLKFARDRKIDGMGIRRLHAAVYAPANRECVARRRGRKPARSRGRKQAWRNSGDACKTRCTTDGYGTWNVRNLA